MVISDHNSTGKGEKCPYLARIRKSERFWAEFTITFKIDHFWPEFVQNLENKWPLWPSSYRQLRKCSSHVVHLAVISFVYYGISLNIGSYGGNIFISFALAGLVEAPGMVFSIISMRYFGRRILTPQWWSERTFDVRHRPISRRSMENACALVENFVSEMLLYLLCVGRWIVPDGLRNSASAVLLSLPNWCNSSTIC